MSTTNIASLAYALVTSDRKTTMADLKDEISALKGDAVGRGRLRTGYFVQDLRRLCEDFLDRRAQEILAAYRSALEAVPPQLATADEELIQRMRNDLASDVQLIEEEFQSSLISDHLPVQNSMGAAASRCESMIEARGRLMVMHHRNSAPHEDPQHKEAVARTPESPSTGGDGRERGVVERLLSIFAALGALVALVWLVIEPGFEPLYALLVGVLTAVSIVGHRRSKVQEQGRVPTYSGSVKTESTFESEFWPEEGIPVFAAASDQLTLYERPSAGSKIVDEHRVVEGEEISYSAFRYRTMRSGRIVCREPTRLLGRVLGELPYISREMYYQTLSSPIQLDLVPGDDIEFLQYRAEGTGFVRWNGEIIDLEYCPWLGPSTELVLTSRPVTESWIQVVDASEEPLGWALVDDQAVETGRRL